MWHRRRRRRLGVKTNHRKALVRNLVRGLALSRQIETTLSRAKEASRLADQMVTLAKQGTLAARRQMISRLGSPEIAKIFIDQIAPRLVARNGGYTRVLKLGPRKGDGAEIALVEFSVPLEITPVKKEKKKKEKKPKPPKPAVEEKEGKVPPEKEKAKKEKEKEKEKEKAEAEKRGGFLSRLRKFLKGEE